MDPKEIKNKFKAKRDHLRTWVNRFRNAQNIAPLVQRELEKAEWEFNAVNDCPDGAVGDN